MEKRYSDSKSSKTPVIIICIAAILIIAVVVVFIVLNNSKKENSTNGTESTFASSTVLAETTIDAQAETTSRDSQPQTTTAAAIPTTSSTQQNETTEKVVVPTKSTESGNCFNATYVPYKAIDTYTNSECSLKEVFGSSYLNGTVTFNSDGTFTDTLTQSSANSGAYAVEGKNISATYSDDKNMSIKVNSWDGDTPSEIVIDYAGYDVYFNM